MGAAGGGRQRGWWAGEAAARRAASSVQSARPGGTGAPQPPGASQSRSGAGVPRGQGQPGATGAGSPGTQARHHGGSWRSARSSHEVQIIGCNL